MSMTNDYGMTTTTTSLRSSACNAQCCPERKAAPTVPRKPHAHRLPERQMAEHQSTRARSGWVDTTYFLSLPLFRSPRADYSPIRSQSLAMEWRPPKKRRERDKKRKGRERGANPNPNITHRWFDSLGVSIKLYQERPGIGKTPIEWKRNLNSPSVLFSPWSAATCRPNHPSLPLQS